MLIYMMRHGQTDWNLLHRVQGRSDIELNETGLLEAHEAGQAMAREGLKFDLVYASPLARADRTANIVLEEIYDKHFVADKKPEIINNDLLMEFAFGELEGALYDMALDNPEHPLYGFMHDPESYVPVPGAESFDEVRGRFNSFINDVLSPIQKNEDPEGNGNELKVLVTCHGGFIRESLCIVTGRPRTGYQVSDQKLANCSVCIYRLKDDELSLVKLGKMENQH